MNISIPPFYCYVRREHFFAYESHQGEFEYCRVFGARAVSGRALLFHVMTEEGVQRANVPISAMVHNTEAPTLPLDHLQLWNCFGNEVTVTTFEWLTELRAQVVLKDKSWYWGNYLMTFDFENNSFSLTPHDYKNMHLVAMDNGCYALQPNNRMLWRDSNFITRPLDKAKIPRYKVDKDVFVCEQSDRWVAEHTDCFYYEAVDLNETSRPEGGSDGSVHPQ